jgi:hypothetical protein
MTRELTRRAASVRRSQPLSTAYWTQFTNVRVPESGDLIDLVLVGPSGVHVVIDHPQQPTLSASTSGATADLNQAARFAAEAAVTVAGLLPDRYRHVVTSAVCLPGATEVGLGVGLILAASPDVLRHTWRHQPRLLSTSEAATLAGLLHARLLPCPVEAAATRGLWWCRPTRWWGLRRALRRTPALSPLAATGWPKNAI